MTGSTQTTIIDLIKRLHNQFALKDMGNLSYFLGIQVSRDTTSLYLCQEKYVNKLLQKAGMSDCKPATTTMVTTGQLSTYDRPPGRSYNLQKPSGSATVLH